MQSALEYESNKSQAVCMFDKFHVTFNFKSKVSHDVFKNKNECQLTSIFSSKMSPQCHMPCSTCHFNLWSVNWRVGFFFTRHTTCQNLNCAYQLTCVLCLRKFLRIKCQNLAKNLSKIHIALKYLGQILLSCYYQVFYLKMKWLGTATNMDMLLLHLWVV